MSPPPLLSVIVPVFNGGAAFKSVLEALRHSTLREFELIVVDDGSTDGSEAMAAAFADRLLHTSRPRSGPGEARNIGAAQAAGAYVCFIDADCEVSRDALERIVAAFDDDSLVAVFGSYDDAPAAPGFVATYKNLFHHYTHQRASVDASTFWAGCGAVRKDVFLQLKGFDVARYPRPSIEDIELGYRLSAIGKVRLDPAIQVKHHKAWTFATLLRSDIFDRAIPWTRLMLGRGRLTNDLNVETRHRVSGILAWLVLLGLLAMVATRWAGLLAVAAGVVLLLLNRDVYTYFASKRGVWFASRAAVLHWLYYLYSVAAFAVGFILESIAPHRAASDVGAAVSPDLTTPVDTGRAGSRGETIGVNFSILSAGQLITKLLAFGMTVKLTRALQADGFGVIVFATSLLAYAALIAGFGFEHLGPIEVARHRVPVQRLVSSVVAIRGAFTVLGFLALLLFVVIAPLSSVERSVTLIYAVSLITSAVALDWVFLGADMMEIAAISQIISQAVLTIGVVALVNSPAQLVVVPYLYLAGEALAAGFLAHAYWRRFGRPDLHVDRAQLRQLLRDAAPLTGTTAVSTISHNFDLVLLGLWLGTAASGLYGAAYRVVWVPTALTTTYYTAIRPSLARAYVAGISSVEHLLAASVRVMTAFGVGITIGGLILARPIVVFLFGSEYLHAVEPLRWLLGAFALIAVSRNYRLTLICFHKQSVDFRIMLAAAVINVVLNVVLIPKVGIRGAAIAAIASESVIFVASYFATRMLLAHVPFGRYFVRALLCAMPMVIVILMSDSLALPLRIALGGTVFAIATLLTRMIRIEEVRMLLRAWRRAGRRGESKAADERGGLS